MGSMKSWLLQPNKEAKIMNTNQELNAQIDDIIETMFKNCEKMCAEQGFSFSDAEAKEARRVWEQQDAPAIKRALMLASQRK
jgi:hypothetical protein